MPNNGDTSPSIGMARQVDRICDEFETAFRAGSAPRIEDFVGSLAGTTRSLALAQLVLLELELCAETGASVDASAWRKRFPDEVAVVQQALDKHSRSCEDSERAVVTTVAGKSAPASDIRYKLSCPECNEPVLEVVGQLDQEVQCPRCGSSFAVDLEHSTTWAPEKLPQLGKFELLEAVGRGSFGTVYRARDTELDRVVAVKVPRSGTFSTDEDEQRFVGEARKVAHLTHRGIVPVYDVGRAEGVPYIVAEFVDGLTLADALTFKRFTARETAELVAEIAATLHHAHLRGVVHRDLKPANIMLETRDASDRGGDSTVASSGASGTNSGKHSTLEHRPRLMDFGLARREGDKVAVTLEGQLLGTPAYMSPEQARGEAHDADGRADIYSLGVIAYELLGGERPFRGNVRAVLHQIVHDDAPSVRRLNSTVSTDLDTICLKCLEKNPDSRYQTAGELHDELQRFLRGEPIHARPIGSLNRVWRWCARRKTLTATVGVSTAVVLLAVAIAFVAVTRQRDRALELAARLKAAKELAVALGRDWGTTLGNYTGVVIDVQGDLEGARSMASRAVTVFDDLVELDPRDSGHREALARARGILGAVHYHSGEYESAVSQLEASQSDFTRLLDNVDEPTQRQEFLHSRANTTIFLATTYRGVGRYAGCLTELDSAIRDFETLIDDHASPEYEMSQAIARLDQGQVLRQIGRNPEAEIALRAALDFATRGSDSNSDSSQSQELEAACLDELGAVLGELGQHRDAMNLHLTSIQILTSLEKSNPQLLGLVERLAIAESHLAQSFHKLERYDESREQFKASVTHLDELLQIPNVTYAVDAALVYQYFGDCLHDVGEPESARDAYAVAGQLWADVLARARHAEYLHQHARFLIECPVEELQDADLAVALTKEAISIFSENAEYHTSLGMALHDADEFDQAIAALNRAVQVRGSLTDRDAFFLSMSEARRGDRDAAQKHFEEAVRWMNEHRPGNLRLSRVKEEAGKLLDRAGQ